MNKTLNDCLRALQAARPNPLAPEELTTYLSRINAAAALETADLQLPDLTFPEDEQTELFIPFPFEDIYTLYSMAQLDLLEADMTQYTNDAAAFTARWEEYLAWSVRTRKPKQSRWNWRWFR